MDKLMRSSLLGAKGIFWEYDQETDQYHPNEGIPTLDPDHEEYYPFYLTDMGRIYDTDEKVILDFIPPLKQFVYSNIPIIFGITIDNELMRISLRSRTAKIIKKNIIHIIGQGVDYNRRRQANEGILEVVDSDGDRLRYEFNPEFNRVINQENLGYFSNQIYKTTNGFAITADGIFDINYFNISKINNTPPGIIDVIYGLTPDEIQFILLLDDQGELYSTSHEYGYKPEDTEFIKCDNGFVNERNETDQWYKLVESLIHGYVGLIGLSGRLCLINDQFAIKSTKLNPEIFRQIPTQSKSARNKA